MSVDTRTPRTPTGGSSSGYDDQPALSTVKVPSDPAQIAVNHVSFRVQLARPPRVARQYAGIADTAQLPTVKGTPKRRAPVVWSGRAAPGDAAPTELLQAVRDSAVTDAGSTQVLPRIRVGDQPPSVVGPRSHGERTGPGELVDAATPETQLLHGVRPTGSAYDEDRYGYPQFGGPGDPDGYDAEYDEGAEGADGEDGATKRHNDSVRHAYYPGRRMNLGVVLLPLRIFLGLISIYAGMGKLCDPVYFDGGKRGSMVAWLTALHPWPAAEPLRDLALAHPVGAGLTVAFLQVVVGVLTIFGLWQRLAASIGVLLSTVLIVTVSWRSTPVYDAPDIIYLAAWSPLVIAGAPFYSIDGRLAGEAWRRLGPRAELWDLRRRVLRRGTIMATVVIGLTLLVGSTLGGAVRSSQTVKVPGPSDPPVNNLPGSPYPQSPGIIATPRGGTHGPSAAGTPTPTAPGTHSATPSATAPAAPGAARTPTGAAAGGAGRPGASQGVRPAPQTPRHQAPPAAPRSPSGGSSASSGTGSTSSSTGGGSSSGGSSSGGTGALGGLLG
ncbi:DoxX family membrane protein [Streptomyces roseoverticillatus]|uniref:DoxX family protein n=1 Tax=Streptomyces roseoverticillatus TaxID=66429 RepID=UPI001F2D23A8|nr:DoxX family protein [Streptomyces roseoverticillatus]MCF3106237.1 DoxX family membrane protein [Streptomyces roseoverticillatus]